MPAHKILLVDDHEAVHEVLRHSLEHHEFEVVTAKGVTEALNQIVGQPFDVLITDLHMPNPGDSFTVVTAMRHSQPDALTLVISGFPDVQEAMAAILLQADEVLVKPFDVKQLVDLIRKRTQEKKRSPKPSKESVASILERDATITTQRWLTRVNRTQELACVPLTDIDRTGHLLEIINSIVVRLRDTRAMEPIASSSPAAVAHGRVRYGQDYTAPMIVQESRILQVCIFETSQGNLAMVDFSLVLPDIMLIADEVDSQLTQSVASFLQDAGAAAA
jgi:ActR/RegA family two-component response regulator